ncbi:MAG: HD domain-containing protein [Gammaproteobacteria bacterium]|nr:HD domain-containing protein [Gammaproteobacteria bacterium]
MPEDTRSTDWGALEDTAPLSQKLDYLLQSLRAHGMAVERLAVVVYDPPFETLKTFLSAGDDPPTLSNYQARLADLPSLQALVTQRQVRVIDDMKDSPTEHSRHLLAAGFHSSYTLPIFHEDQFFGFIFCNSRVRGFFTLAVVGQLEPILRLFALIVIDELRAVNTLEAATATARYITSHRDCETGAHLGRMASYSQLIAHALAETLDLSDEYIEYLFLFAPLHDLGKIAIPDSILLKPAPLTVEEYDLMKSHTVKGRDMVEFLIHEFHLSHLTHIDVLRNIVLSHHEAYDGSGYPEGLSGEAIPLAARIVTTADVLDALASQRPYKPAWPLDIALAELKRLAGKQLDPQCVGALVARRDEIEAIARQYQETVYG